MSNGIDSLANGYTQDLSNMVSSTPESSYVGQDFTGTVMPNQNVYDVGPGQMPSPEMFGTDSMNPLGASEQYRGSNMESMDMNMCSPDMNTGMGN